MLSKNYKNILILEKTLNKMGLNKEALVLAKLIKSASNPDAKYEISKELHEILKINNKINKILKAYIEYESSDKKYRSLNIENKLKIKEDLDKTNENLTREDKIKITRDLFDLSLIGLNVSEKIRVLSEEIIWYFELKNERMKDEIQRLLKERINRNFNLFYDFLRERVYNMEGSGLNTEELFEFNLRFENTNAKINNYLISFGEPVEEEYRGEKIQFDPYEADTIIGLEKTSPGTGSPYSLRNPDGTNK